MTKARFLFVLLLACACGVTPSHPDRARPSLASSADAGPPRRESFGPAPDTPPLRAATVLMPDAAIVEPEVKAVARLSAKRAGNASIDFGLRETRVRAEVSGTVARVSVEQVYVNPSSERLEAIYQFPLPDNAAVTDMYMRIGSRVVYSEVRKKQEARRTYEKAKGEGKTAALTEEERPNLFTQSVANIPPAETVAVVLRYTHEVPFDDGRYVLHFPTTIGPRYVPGEPATGAPKGHGYSPDTDRVPDGSRVTPPVVSPGFASANALDITVRLVDGAAFDGLASKSHPVLSGFDEQGARVVTLTGDDRRANKDFVLTYRPARPEPEARAFVQSERGNDYMLLFLQPPNRVEATTVRPREMVFVVDKSGSMSGAPLDTCKALVGAALDRRGPDDTFQIVAFDGGYETMTPAPVEATADNVERAKGWMTALAGTGGTEMLAGIRAALAPAEDPKRLRLVVLCTDGFIGNEREIIDAVGATLGRARVFGFGVGSSVNRYLIDGVARAGRGVADVVREREEPTAAVRRLFSRIDRPVLTDIDVAFEGIDVRDVYPPRPPDLFAGQPLVLVARLVGGREGTAHVRGTLGSRRFDRRVKVVPIEAQETPVLGTLWARRRIDHLSFLAPGAPAEREQHEIEALGLTFKLVTPFTSFVAVERTLLTDPKLPLTQMLVPNELPEGVDAKGIFGDAPPNVQVLPSRVKPGDPEVRIRAAADVIGVTVHVPFEPSPREAVRDPETGEFALRFLVPSDAPDGDYEVPVTLATRTGRTEHISSWVHVDTAPGAVVVLSAPAKLAAGSSVQLRFKAAVAVRDLVGRLRGRAPGAWLATAKAAMDVSEVMVRAPWGETTVATPGVLGTYVATLHAPADFRSDAADFDVVVSDAAGNIGRRTVRIGAGAPPSWAALVVLGGVAFAAERWRRRRRVHALTAPETP